MLRYGGMAGAASLIGKKAYGGGTCIGESMVPSIEMDAFTNCAVIEAFPPSPFILQPFTQDMPIPTALRPGWRYPDGTLSQPGDSNAWFVRKSVEFGDNSIVPPGPGKGIARRCGPPGPLRFLRRCRQVDRRRCRGHGAHRG